MHIKFDHFFKHQGFITLYLNIIYQRNLSTCTAHHGEFNEIYRTCIAYTEVEIIPINSIMSIDQYAIVKKNDDMMAV